MILYSKNLLMAQEKEDVNKILPVEWGKLKSFGVSVSPSDHKSDPGTPTKSFCFVTDKGAFVVNTSINTIIPTTDQLLSAYFIQNTYTEEFNGGIYNVGNANAPKNVWCPVIYKVLIDRYAWFYFEECIRNVRFTTLARWGWDRKYDNLGKDYTYKIVNNKMLIYYLGNLVLTLY